MIIAFKYILFQYFMQTKFLHKVLVYRVSQ